MYTEKVMDHFQNPRNVGEIENASGVGTVGNAKCGDIMRIYLDIDENQIIQDVKFKTFGCGAAVATSSMATELVKGKTIYEALQVTNKAVMEALDGLPPVKVHCSLLAEEAIHAVKVPIIGMGGIATAEDAIEMLLVGASAVSVGTANFHDPAVTMKVVDGIESYMKQQGFETVADMVGIVK